MGKRLIVRILELRRGRRTVLLLFDLGCYVLAYLMCRALSAMTGLFRGYEAPYLVWGACQLGAIFGARFLLRGYRNVWRYGSSGAYLQLMMADFVGSVAVFVPAMVLGREAYAWQLAVVGSFDLLLVVGIRITYTVLYRRHEMARKPVKRRTSVAIIGAGHIGSYLADDMTTNPESKYEPLFFIDKDPAKRGKLIRGIPIYSAEKGVEQIRKRGVETVIVTIKSDDGEFLMSLYNKYSELGCQLKICDALVKEGEQKPEARSIRSFRIEDILFRQPIDLSNQKAKHFYEGKTVLITGGGGSIGSELCRQVAACEPKRLIIFDIYENNAYDIQQELIRTYGDRIDLSVEIGSVRDVQKLDRLFDRYRPNIVFHAAAHKHVPLMELCSAEAVKNNVVGTYNTANMAEKYQTEKFILISTDKAVNPTNIMGASKRMCEMIIQCRTQSRTSFAAVRFGNVLGSNGSVVPLFRRQIAEGGPITITDKRIIRYFMTIPEASQLVLQAGAMACNGELFVLDMGKPVKIYDLAVSMIRLSGLVLEKDIQIKEIGLRPGEKLYEELLMKNETLDETENHLIFIERDTRYTREEVMRKLNRLNKAVNEGGSVQQAFLEVVPTYHLPEEVNKTAEQSEEMKLAASVS